MQDVAVLWLVEHVAREMDVACAVKVLAERRYGLEVQIKHVYLHAHEVMRKYRPQVVAVPFFYGASDLAIGDYVRRWPDALFLNLAWEEIFYKGHAKIKAPTGNFALHKVVHHAWGRFYQRYLVENGVLEENVYVNGNPVYQLYLPPYSRYFRDRSWLAQRYGLDPDRCWVFVPENYRWAFIADGTIEWRVRQGANRAELLAMREFARDSLVWLLTQCNEIAECRDFQVIFRPKPATMLREMQDFFRERVGKRQSPGLFLTKGESVREWILASDVVISSFSTTLIEASMADRPAYMVEPLPITDSFSADWYEHVPRIVTEADFEAACTTRSSDRSSALRAWATRTMLANGDPISNLADFLCQLTTRQRVKNDFLSSLGEPLRRWKQMAKPKRQYFNPRTHESDIFTDEDVHVKAAEWSKILGG